jgi:hypothetical protein
MTASQNLCIIVRSTNLDVDEVVIGGTDAVNNPSGA